ELETLLYIRQTWHDYRLSWNATDLMKIKLREHFLDKLWLPDIRFRNMKDVKHFKDFGSINMNLYSDGRVYFSQLALVKVSCPMDLHNFPMDKQTCYLNLSSYAYGKSLLRFSLSKSKTIVKPLHLPQFNLVETRRLSQEDEDIVGKVSISLTFQRQMGYYILQVYIPTIFLVLLSWLAFLMEATDIANRLALEVTMILSIVFLLGNSNSSLPHLSYAKASDLFIIASFGFIFMALLQTMLTFHLVTKKPFFKSFTSCNALARLKKYFVVLFPGFKWKRKDEREQVENAEEDERTGYLEDVDDDVVFQSCSTSEKEVTKFWFDKMCLVAFPTFYIIFNVSYWSYYA
ncbi:gamma-aminobutyric acid receptor subunit gamma-2-like, partial [Dendronephthya gigantea]|uniref:gamma-aminobutyric acid receptor subunit gamma-2-like n=1 Tax=Dendronephthya gigantea TaxID=151771 RepID=UPI00106D6BCD